MIRYRLRTTDPVQAQALNKSNTDIHAPTFTVSVSFKKMPDGSHPFYKVDGKRFQQEKTVKLYANCKYWVEVVFRPPQALLSFNLDGDVMEMETKEGSDHKSIYLGNWNSEKNEISSKGQRKNIPLRFDIIDRGFFRTTMQCKFYKEGDKHHGNWGDTFHCIEYECRYNDATASCDILKETFR